MARKNEDLPPINLDGEKWVLCPGFDGYYYASSLGRVRSTGRSGRTPKIVGAVRKTSGYVVASRLVNGKLVNTYCHRIIAIAFIPNPDNKSEVNHKNGIKTDNRPENLEWVTPSENMKHCFEYGLKNNKGENQSQHKLTEVDVIDIRVRHLNGQGIRSIGRVYEDRCSLRNVRNIIDRKKWIHI
jgi:hypothetical protein